MTNHQDTITPPKAPAMRAVNLHTFELETLALAIERMEAKARRRGDHELGDIHAARAAEIARLAR